MGATGITQFGDFPEISYGNRIFGELGVNSRWGKIIFNQAHDGYGSFQSSAGTYHVLCGVKSYEEIIQYGGRGHNIQNTPTLDEKAESAPATDNQTMM